MAVTHYAWDPEFDQVTKELDENGATIAEYTCEPKRHGQIMSQHRGGVTSIYHYDAQGSTRALTNHNQNVTDTAVYTAFGEKVASTRTTVNPFGYVGALGYHSGTSNHAYVRARDYEFETARWMSIDPGWPSSGINKYVYVNNQPLILTDPSGLIAHDPDTSIIGAIVITGVAEGFWAFCPKLKAVASCQRWMAINGLIGSGWLGALPACPCSIGMPPTRPEHPENTWLDPEHGDQIHHPGSVNCIRSRALRGHSQQCCYDGSGKLITSGSAAGTPDFGGFPGNPGVHFTEDVLPFWMCCSAGKLDKYLKFRPPNNANNCPENKIDRPIDCSQHRLNTTFLVL